MDPMRLIPLLLLAPMMMAAEPPRWSFGSGTVGGLEAQGGQEISLPTAVVAGPRGARIDLGDEPAGEVLLGPQARAVLSVEDGVTIINLQGAAEISRRDSPGDLRLRLPHGEVAIATGVLVGEVLPNGTVVMVVTGNHQARGTVPGQPREAWKALAPGQAAAVEERGIRTLGTQRRPQILPNLSVAEQLAGRAQPPTGTIDNLGDNERDDLALTLIQEAAATDPGAALRHLRFLAATNRAAGLAATQILLAVAPARAEDALVALVDGGVPVDRAAAITAFAVPDRAIVLTKRALQLGPAASASIIRLVTAAAPEQAEAVRGLVPTRP